MTAESVSSDSHQSTLRHITLIRAKRENLRAAQIEAERQLCHRIGTDFAAGRLSEADLCELYDEYRLIAEPGFSDRWGEHLPFSGKQMSGVKGRLRWREALSSGPWSGEYPFLGHGQEPTPPTGCSVVYVLFDAKNIPCYVGSTKYFSSRLTQHHRAGKRFGRWMAQHCANREAAYLLEERLLREHKPYLNVRASR